METYRANQLRLKGDYTIESDFLDLNEDQRFELGKFIETKGIVSISTKLLTNENGKYYFDLFLFKYFKNISRVSILVNSKEHPNYKSFGFKNINILSKFIDTLEEVNISFPEEDVNYLLEFPKLRYISLSKKYFNIINQLNSLKEISIGKEDIFNLDLKLKTIEFIRCSTSINLDKLNGFNLENLKGLEVFMCRDFSDISFLSKCKKLEAIKFEWLPRIESLPDFTNCPNLKSIWISTMSRLADIKSIATVKNIERVLISNCKLLKIDDFRFLAEMHSLKYVVCGYRSKKEENELKDLFGEKFSVEEVNKNIILSP